MCILKKNHTYVVCILSTRMPQIETLLKLMLVYTWYQESMVQTNTSPLPHTHNFSAQILP